MPDQTSPSPDAPLLGHASAKGQQLEDHYFWSIPSRVLSYMRDLEVECMLLGIPVKTRHNEVAPNQFELAPIFEEVNLAVDHNSLLMDVMQKVAERHNFRVLLHEKPLPVLTDLENTTTGLWPLTTGVNLWVRANTNEQPPVFDLFINTIKAVHNHEELVRASIASASNDHRLCQRSSTCHHLNLYWWPAYQSIERTRRGIRWQIVARRKTELKKLNVVGKILKSCSTIQTATGPHPLLLPATNLNSERWVHQPLCQPHDYTQPPSWPNSWRILRLK